MANDVTEIYLFYENKYYNQRNGLVAKSKWSVIRIERAKAKEKGKYQGIQLPHPWTKAELKEIEEEILSEEVRGSNTRYWEDVKVGEELPPVVKGIFGLTDMIAYCVGAAPVQIAAHGVQLRLYRKHPAWAFRDPVLGSWEPVYGVHYLASAAKGVGALVSL
jgi:hypothetical protein